MTTSLAQTHGEATTVAGHLKTSELALWRIHETLRLTGNFVSLSICRDATSNKVNAVSGVTKDGNNLECKLSPEGSILALHKKETEEGMQLVNAHRIETEQGSPFDIGQSVLDKIADMIPSVKRDGARLIVDISWRT